MGLSESVADGGEGADSYVLFIKSLHWSYFAPCLCRLRLDLEVRHTVPSSSVQTSFSIGGYNTRGYNTRVYTS
jgi:hypothetical protein